MRLEDSAPTQSANDKLNHSIHPGILSQKMVTVISVGGLSANERDNMTRSLSETKFFFASKGDGYPMGGSLERPEIPLVLDRAAHKVDFHMDLCQSHASLSHASASANTAAAQKQGSAVSSLQATLSRLRILLHKALYLCNRYLGTPSRKASTFRPAPPKYPFTRPYEPSPAPSLGRSHVRKCPISRILAKRSTKCWHCKMAQSVPTHGKVGLDVDM